MHETTLSVEERIAQAEAQQWPPEKIKPLYIERNSFFLEDYQEAPIYRVLAFEDLRRDISEKKLTMTRIDKQSLTERQENPCWGKSVYIEGEKVSLNGLFGEHYGSYWSLRKNEKVRDIVKYETPIIVSSTPTRLMSSLCCLDDEFYMLRCFVGQMQYLDWKDITAEMSQLKLDDIDRGGMTVAKSFLVLDKNDYEHEKEVRLIYSYQPTNNDYVRDHVSVVKKDGVTRCKRPFDWDSVLTGYTIPEECTLEERSTIDDFMAGFGVSPDP